MKSIHKFIIVLTVILIGMLAFPSPAHAAPSAEDRIVIGESYTLENGRILDGDLNVIGGVVEIKSRATVNGNVFVLGGLVTIDGTVKGDLTAIGGTVNLSESAVVEGDLVTPVSYINIDPDANIIGNQIQRELGTESFSSLRNQIRRTRTFSAIPILTRIGKFLVNILVLFALGALLLLIMPKSADRMIYAINKQPWSMLGFGFLSTLVMASILLLTITICLIPFVILVGLVYATALLVGWLALGYLLGKRIANGIFKTTWHPVLNGAVGNLVLYLIAWGVGRIPCVGWFPIFIAMQFGLGMVITTLFGTYTYPRTICPEEDVEPVVLFEEGKPEEAIITPIQAQDTTKELPNATLEDETDDVIPQTPEVKVVARPEVPIEILNLGERSNNVLIDAGLTTVDDVLAKLERSEESMLDIPGFGKKSLADLKNALLASGYKLP
ncbi:MAG: DNA-directed RNA polymerase subunit alpha C-terminal domain-containing protein [Brevefilum sp.]